MSEKQNQPAVKEPITYNDAIFAMALFGLIVIGFFFYFFNKHEDQFTAHTKEMESKLFALSVDNGRIKSKLDKLNSNLVTEPYSYVDIQEYVSSVFDGDVPDRPSSSIFPEISEILKPTTQNKEIFVELLHKLAQNSAIRNGREDVIRSFYWHSNIYGVYSTNESMMKALKELYSSPEAEAAIEGLFLKGILDDEESAYQALNIILQVYDFSKWSPEIAKLFKGANGNMSFYLDQVPMTSVGRKYHFTSEGRAQVYYAMLDYLEFINKHLKQELGIDL